MTAPRKASQAASKTATPKKSILRPSGADAGLPSSSARKPRHVNPPTSAEGRSAALDVGAATQAMMPHFSPTAQIVTSGPSQAAARAHPPAKPARRWRAYQLAADEALTRYGIFILLWRRQSGKTEVLSTWALQTMLAHAGATVILASASLNVGGEVALRAAGVFWQVLERLRARFASLEATSVEEGSAPRLLADFDALKDAFIGGKLEVRFTHPGGLISRLKVLAPNPATARGFTGTVFLDEIGFIPDFRALWDAVEPITSSDPTFRLIMCTTPPPDTAHYSHELIVPPPDLDFEHVAPEGVWYRSQAGIMVHRCDAWDAEAAGAVLYHPETRQPISAEEHRTLALDKEAWDRNYALRLASTGTEAVALHTLHFAQSRPEAAQCLAIEGELPADWRRRLGELSEPVTIGFDIATTEKKKSNPSALTVLTRSGAEFAARLVWRWKTNDPKVSLANLRELVSTLKVRCLLIDATSEKFFAKGVRDALARLCPVLLVVSSENITVGQTEYLTKTYLGNLLTNALADGHVALPSDRWLATDFRLVRRVRGGFDAEVDGSGNHADTFDSTKLALHGWLTPVTGAFTAETLAAVSLGGSARRLPTIPRPTLR
jgi:hypothetical protein